MTRVNVLLALVLVACALSLVTSQHSRASSTSALQQEEVARRSCRAGRAAGSAASSSRRGPRRADRASRASGSVVPLPATRGQVVAQGGAARRVPAPNGLAFRAGWRAGSSYVLAGVALPRPRRPFSVGCRAPNKEFLQQRLEPRTALDREVRHRGRSTDLMASRSASPRRSSRSGQSRARSRVKPGRFSALVRLIGPSRKIIER